MSPADDELVRVESDVLVRERLQLFGQLIKRIYGVGSACWHAGTTIDAAIGVNVQQGGGFEGGFVFLGMNAIGRAGINA